MAEPTQMTRPTAPVNRESDPADETKVLTSSRFGMLQAELELRSRMQRAVAELGAAALTPVDAMLLAAQACGLLVDTLVVDAARLAELVPDEQRFVTRAAVGVPDLLLEDELDSEAITAYHTEEPVVVTDFGAETRYSPSPALRTLGVRSALVVRLPGRRRPLGVLAIYSRSQRSFLPYEVEFATSIGNVIAAAIESKRDREELERTHAQMRRHERLASIASWSWSRGERTWKWSDELYRLIGSNPSETAPDYKSLLSFVHPADRTGLAALIEIASREAGEHMLEHRLVTPQGETRHVRTTVQTTFGYGKRPLRIVGTLQDLSFSTRAEAERVRYAALIELAAQEWRMTCDAIASVVLVLDGNGLILRANEAARRILHLSFDDLLGRQIPPAAAGEPWSTISQLVTVVAETHLPARSDAFDELRGKQWDILGRSLGKPRGEDERVVIVATDVSEASDRERVRRRGDVLDAVLQLVLELEARVKPQLTVVNSIVGEVGAEVSRDDARRIRGATKELQGLFAALRDYASPFDLHTEAASLTPLAHEALASSTHVARRAAVALRSKVEETRPILLRRERVHRLIEILAAMMICRAHPGQEVLVRLTEMQWKRQDWVQLTFSAEGNLFRRDELLMPEVPLPQLSDDGSSLKVAIARRIADEHGGRLIFRTKNGISRAIVRFPVAR